MAGTGSTDEIDRPRFVGGANLRDAVAALVDKTPFVDTHEHFWEESKRISALTEKDRSLPAPDFGMLMSHYTDSDLQVVGMPMDDYKRLLSWDLTPTEKWRIVEPWYKRCRHTGYQACLRETVQRLYSEDDLRADTVEAVSAALAARTTPGFYQRTLRETANIDYAHVNCIQSTVFRDTEQPELLAVDLSINALFGPPKRDVLRDCLGKDATTLAEGQRAIDACFEKYGPRAIAVKSQCAYWRSLDFPQTTEEDAAPLFAKWAREEGLTPEEQAVLEGFLFHYCMEKAAEFKLPVKLHTGYLAGRDGMLLSRTRNNAGDLCPVFKAHPNTLFSLFHIAYPYQDEVIALAKHYSNVYVDMCWAWIINPAASTRFLKEFIMAAPACKLFTFGGDYLPVEMSVGHAAVARRGIALALSELMEEGWLDEEDAPDLIERIMRGNANELFDRERAAAHAVEALG